MSSDDPPFLAKDTKISGKFKGAYCEAVILRVEKKIRITVKRDPPATGTTVIEDRHIPADKLVLGAKIDVVIDGDRVKGTVHHFKDNSRYHVAFTDGDQKTLRRSQVRLQGAKHFNPDGTLDSMPLTNPEHFSTPVVRDAARRSTGGAGPSSSTPKTKPKRSSDDDEEKDDESGDDAQPPATTPKPKSKKKKDSDEDDDEEGEGEEVKKKRRNRKAEAKARRERGALARERKRAEIQVLEKHRKRMMAIWKKAAFLEAKNRHVKDRKAFLGKKTKSFLRRRPFPKLKRTKRCSLWYASRKYMKQCKKTSLLMTNKTWYHRIREWLKPVKNEKREFRFCVAYRDTRIADGLLRLVDEWLENGEENQELRPPIERRTIEFDQRKGRSVFDHFLDSEWYPAILTRRVFIGTNGQRTREIRNMADGTVQRINEADVIPYEWVPDFDEDDLDYVVRRRVPAMREAFEAAHEFIGKMMKQVPDLDHTTLRIMLGYQKIKKPKTGKLKKLQTHFAPIPTDPEIIESGGESSEEDSDSDEDDDSIKNAPTEEKDRFLATLLQSDITLNTSPQIQGYDVDLYYLYGLALKIGAPRKVHAARPWSKWARKLVPQAVDAGPEVEALFKTTLEAHMNTTSKLSFPMEQMMVTTERRAVVPGQYSENRRRTRETPAGARGQDRPSTSGRGGRGGARRGGGRKRKEGSLDSNGERKRPRADDQSSRATTTSPAPSDGPPSDDDDTSVAASEDSRGKKKTPRGSGVPKKMGRPRKHPQEPRVHRPTGRNAERALPVNPNDPDYCRANVISYITKASKIRASYGDQWFNGNAIEVVQDFSFDLLTQMLHIQDAIGTAHEVQVRDDAFREVHGMWTQMSTKTHYSGWNSRYDEYMTFEKLMVTKRDQYRSRRRFRKLPGGERLRPETLAILERRFCEERDSVVKPDYRELAREAFENEEYDEEEMTNIETIIMRRTGGTGLEAFRRRQEEDSDEEEKSDDEEEEALEAPEAHRRRLLDSDESEEDEEAQEPRRRRQQDSGDEEDSRSPRRRREDSGDDRRRHQRHRHRQEAPEEVDEMELTPKEQRRLEARQRHQQNLREVRQQIGHQHLNSDSPELGDSRSATVSARVSRQATPESEESSGLRREGDSRHVSREATRSPRGSDEEQEDSGEEEDVEEKEQDSEGHQGPDYDYEAPPRRRSGDSGAEDSEAPEDAEATTEEAEGQDSEDSDDDEPQYPTLPRSPVGAGASGASGAPENLNPASQMTSPESAASSTSSQRQMAGEGSSANQPQALRSPQQSTSSAQAPPTPSPPATRPPPLNPLQSSGPLTLDDSIHSTGPLERRNEEEDPSTSSSHDNRARSNTMMSSSEQRPSKRQRRASERSSGAAEEPAKRNLLHPQFSSGALTLQETSGPIVPAQVPKGPARRNTASPQISNSGPLTVSGPLTLASPSTSSSAPPLLVENAPIMPPPPPAKPQIGRPRKSTTPHAGAAAQAPPTSDEASAAGSAPEAEPGASTSSLEAAAENLSGSSAEDVQNPEESPEAAAPEVITPRGGSQRGGARKKRGGRGGGAQRTPKGSVKRSLPQSNPNLDDIDDDEGTPFQATPTHHHHPRGEGFVAQKNRMAAEMEADGTDRNFHELGLEPIEVLIRASPQDENLLLEERSIEVKDTYMQTKYEFSQLEKRMRRQREAKARREAEEAAAAEEAARSRSPQPGPSGFVGHN